MKSNEEKVIEMMLAAGVDLVATLPCDRTKNLLPLFSDSFQEIRLTREENGVGICAGAYLAGARPMMVIQSTGLGNMINALASLNMACRIPLPILASWRGVYKEGIDAQKPLGRHLPGILSGAGLYHTVIDETEKLPLLSRVIADAHGSKSPHIALVSPEIWEDSTCNVESAPAPLCIQPRGKQDMSSDEISQPTLMRGEAISVIARQLDRELVVSNLGVPSKELYAAGDRDRNYYMTGSMGLVSAIGLGLSLKSAQSVVVLEGDGSILMNPNAIIEAGKHAPANLMIIALDNACYGSTGSQETFTCRTTDLELFAKSVGFQNTARVHTAEELEEAFLRCKQRREISFIHVILKPGNSSVPNIPLSPAEITERFKNAVSG